MPRLNKKIILYNIKDAREELENIEKLLEESKLSETDLQIMLEHAYHHLNFAWNIRFLTGKRFKELSDDDFNEGSKYPKELEIYKIEKN